MFDELWRRLDLSRDNIATVAKTIPKDVDQAYAAILNKSPDKSKARKLLRIVLAAMTPLSVEEINVAMVVGESTNSHKDLEWSQAFRPKRIEEGIVVYDTDRIRQEKRAFIRRYVLSYYAATNWSNHLVLAGDLTSPTLLQVVAHDICNPLCYSWGTWAQIYVSHGKGHYAVEEGHESLVNILIQRNADIESRDDRGGTPLYYAADAGEDGTIKILLESVAHVDSQDIHDRTALHWTVIGNPLNGRTKKRVLVIVTLLGNGAEINHKDSVGRTPLSNACYFAGRNAVYLEGALDEDRKSIDGLAWPNRVNPEDSIKLLLEKGADVVTEDNWKRTPLFYAAYNGSTKFVKLLLQSGARLDSRTIEGNTPLGIAKSSNHECKAR
ncbi:MAG: hypothetical protein Q9228_005501 [Teloschistes exilis]